MKRPLLAWLLLVVLFEANGLLLLRSWVIAKNELVVITNLVAAAPGSNWWALAINQTILVMLIGLALLLVHWYGVLTGIILFLLALPFLSEIL